MYLVNTVKRVISYGTEFIYHKEQNYRLENVPNTRVSTDLLHEISHNNKISYIAFFTWGQLTPHTFENSGVNLNFLSSFSMMKLK